MKPTIILIPGAWHTGSCYDLLTPLLKNQGYDVQPLTLPSVGPDAAKITGIQPDVDYIKQNLVQLLDAGKEVVLVMHSYGGIPGSSAVKGLGKKEREAEGTKGGVVALVFIAAWMIPEGLSAKGAGGGRGGKGGPSTLKIENGVSQHLDPITAMYHDVSPELGEKFASGLKPFAVATLDSPTTHAGQLHIPTTYLLCKNDKMIPIERQEKLVAEAKESGAQITSFTCDASHSPFASQPELTARVVRRAAGEEVDVGGL